MWALNLLILYRLRNRWWILQLRTKMSSVQNDTMDGWKWIKEHSVLWDWSTSQKIQIFPSTLIAHPVILREAKLSRRIYWITNYKFFAKWNGIAESIEEPMMDSATPYNDVLRAEWQDEGSRTDSLIIVKISPMPWRNQFRMHLLESQQTLKFPLIVILREANWSPRI